MSNEHVQTLRKITHILSTITEKYNMTYLRKFPLYKQGNTTKVRF